MRKTLLQEDVGSEMRRLKLEMEQRMGLYSTDCTEVLNARQPVEPVGMTGLGSSYVNYDSFYR